MWIVGHSLGHSFEGSGVANLSISVSIYYGRDVFTELLLLRSAKPDYALSGCLVPVDADEVPEVQCSLKGIHFEAL